MRVARWYIIEEEIVQEEVAVVDDGKVACDVCGKRYKARDYYLNELIILTFLFVCL